MKIVEQPFMDIPIYLYFGPDPIQKNLLFWEGKRNPLQFGHICKMSHPSLRNWSLWPQSLLESGFNFLFQTCPYSSVSWRFINKSRYSHRFIKISNNAWWLSRCGVAETGVVGIADNPLDPGQCSSRRHGLVWKVTWNTRANTKNITSDHLIKYIL